MTLSEALIAALKEVSAVKDGIHLLAVPLAEAVVRRVVAPWERREKALAEAARKVLTFAGAAYEDVDAITDLRAALAAYDKEAPPP